MKINVKPPGADLPVGNGSKQSALQARRTALRWPVSGLGGTGSCRPSQRKPVARKEEPSTEMLIR